MMTNEGYVIQHHGILGQKWGVRRYQNADGTRTALGKRRERNGEQGTTSAKKADSSSDQKKGLTDSQKAMLKKVAVGVGVAAAAGLATYGALKYSDAIKEQAFQKTMNRGADALAELEKSSIFNKYLSSDLINDATKGYAIDYHEAVKSHEIDNIRETAKENASTFRKARETLNGGGLRSTPELNAMGIRTYDSTRTDFEEGIGNSLKGAEAAAKREKELAARAAITRHRVRSMH